MDKNSKNLPLLTESLCFQLEFLKELKNLEIQINNNISYDEFKTIQKFQKESPFKVVELDKNIGVSIISKTLYDILVHEHLDDQSTYKKIMFDPLDIITKNINEVLEKLFNEKSISKKLYELLFVKNSKIGTIRILPKLHKNKFGIRPIISYKSNPTNNLCIL